MSSLPLLLTALRAALAPVLVLLALFLPRPPAFAACLVAAFLSDIFDGVIARRLGIATPNLRRWDSIADSLFYAAACFAVWHLQPAALTGRWLPLSVLAGLGACRYALDFLKFRRETACHMWSSKLWGIALFAAFLSLLGFGRDGGLVDAALYLGIAADLEGTGDLTDARTLADGRAEPLPRVAAAPRCTGLVQQERCPATAHGCTRDPDRVSCRRFASCRSVTVGKSGTIARAHRREAEVARIQTPRLPLKGGE